MTVANNDLERDGPDHRPRTLVIGDLERWRAMGRALPQVNGMDFADVGSVTAELLAKIQPEVIFSPLMARDFDAVEIAHELYKVGFGGRYRVVANPLPDETVVQTEVANVAPGLDFAFVHLSEGQVS